MAFAASNRSVFPVRVHVGSASSGLVEANNRPSAFARQLVAAGSNILLLPTCGSSSSAGLWIRAHAQVPERLSFAIAAEPSASDHATLPNRTIPTPPPKTGQTPPSCHPCPKNALSTAASSAVLAALAAFVVFEYLCASLWNTVVMSCYETPK